MRTRFAKLLVLIFICFVFFPACRRDEARQIFDNGLSLWKSEKFDEAIQNFIALTKAFPKHHLVDDSLFWIANIYEHYLQNPDQAVRYYRSLNNKFENSEHHQSSMIGLARVRAMQGDEGKRKAIRIYQKLQKQHSTLKKEDWDKNQFKLAELFFELAQYKQARVELKRLIVENPDSELISQVYFKIGRSYYLEGNLDLAKLTFWEADRKFKFMKVSLDSAISLADIYEEIGQLQAAIEVYQTILNRLKKKEVFYQLANNRINQLKSRLKKTITG